MLGVTGGVKELEGEVVVLHRPRVAAEKGDWLRNSLYLPESQTTISCGACPLFQQPSRVGG